MSCTSGKLAACMKSACVSVTASAQSKTKRCLKSARIPGQPMNPKCLSRGESNTTINQSGLPDETNTIIKQSGLPDETPIITQSGLPDETQSINNITQTLGCQNSLNLSSYLQICADLANNYQLESYRRIASKPERPPRSIDRITSALSLSNQYSISLDSILQICAALVNNRQIESYRRLVSLPGTPSRGPTKNNNPRARGAFAVAPHPDAPNYYEDCAWESMIYSRAYQAEIYTRDRKISSYKPKVDSRAIRKANRFLRKRNEPRTEVNLKVEPTPRTEEQTMTKSMLTLGRASMRAAAEYEIERAELNAKLSLAMHA